MTINNKKRQARALKRQIKYQKRKINLYRKRVNSLTRKVYKLKCEIEDMDRTQGCQTCGCNNVRSGYGRDLYPGSMYDVAETYYNVCAGCGEVLSYTY